MTNVAKGYVKITLPMLGRHVALLDRFAVEMRLRHGIAISRSAILRALVDLAEAKDTAPASRRPRKRS